MVCCNGVLVGGWYFVGLGNDYWNVVDVGLLFVWFGDVYWFVGGVDGYGDWYVLYGEFVDCFYV